MPSGTGIYFYFHFKHCNFKYLLQELLPDKPTKTYYLVRCLFSIFLILTVQLFYAAKNINSLVQKGSQAI
jgi:hypothetical protein